MHYYSLYSCWQLAVAVVAWAALLMGNQASATDLPVLPNSHVWPSFNDPGDMAKPGIQWQAASLELLGRDRVVHRLNLDPSPRGWADRLLEITAGSHIPWEPLLGYALFWESSDTSSVAIASNKPVTVVIAGEIWRFPSLPVPGSNSKQGVGSLPSGAFLSLTPDGLAVSRECRRYHFHPTVRGQKWQLVAIDFLDQPGRSTTLIYDVDSRLNSIRFPNGQQVRVTYARGGEPAIEQIQLPLGRLARLVRDERGFIQSIELYRSVTAPGQHLLSRFSYDCDAYGRILAFTDASGLRRTIEIQSSASSGSDEPRRLNTLPNRSVIVRYDKEGFYQFHHFFAVGAQQRKQPIEWHLVSGYGEPSWTLPRAVEAYQHTAKAVRERTIADTAMHPNAPSPAKLIWGGVVPVLLTTFKQPSDAVGATISPEVWAQRHFGDMAVVELDEVGRIASVRPEPDAKPIITYTYNATGDLVEIRHDKSVYQLQTDEWGRFTAITFPDRSARQWTFDAAGDLLRIVGLPTPIPGSNSSVGDSTSGGQLPPGSMVLQINRDPLGLITGIDAPEGIKRRFAYDRTGRLTTITEISGAAGRVSLRYDKLHRVSQRQDARGNRDTYLYHANGQVAQHDSNPAGLERKIREYDLRGRLVVETTTTLGRIAYEYDDFDRVSRIIHPDRTDTIHTFDEHNRIISIRGSHQPPVDITYDHMGRPTAISAARSVSGSTR